MKRLHAVYRKSEKTILNTDRNQTVFAVKIVPYCVSFLDHISPLCSAKAALPGAIFPHKALSSSYPCSVSMLFLGGDPIEAGLFSLRLGNKAALTCPRHVIHPRGDTSLPLKLPRYSVLFSADNIVF